MSWGSIVVACIAAFGALIAWRYLPAHAAVAQEDEEVRDVARMDDATSAATR